MNEIKLLNEFKLLDRNGHSTTAWDPGNGEELERARRTYESLMRRGYRAFSIDEQGEARALERFDPSETETLFVPPIQGG
jgi:hypothetical protein